MSHVYIGLDTQVRAAFRISDTLQIMCADFHILVVHLVLCDQLFRLTDNVPAPYDRFPDS